MRASTRSIIRMLEEQARILFMDTDRIVDDSRLPCMIDECSGEVTRTIMSIR
jgi:hypothetical protein